MGNVDVIGAVAACGKTPASAFPLGDLAPAPGGRRLIRLFSRAPSSARCALSRGGVLDALESGAQSQQKLIKIPVLWFVVAYSCVRACVRASWTKQQQK